jgi:MFS family permease
LIPSFFSCIIAGLFLDVFGRKKVMIFIWLSSGLSTFLMPYSAPSVYPGLFLCKFLFALSFYPITTVIINDVTTNNTRGRAFSLLHLGMDLG